MEKINLKEILAKHSGAYEAALEFGREEKVAINGFNAITAMEEVWNLAIDKCKEVVQVSGEDSEDYNLNKEMAQDSLEQIKHIIK
jgi:hypothetical protein